MHCVLHIIVYDLSCDLLVLNPYGLRKLMSFNLKVWVLTIDISQAKR